VQFQIINILLYFIIFNKIIIIIIL